MTTSVVVTNNGLSKIASAVSSGGTVSITYFKIGSSLITPTATMTDVTSAVYTGTTSQLSISASGSNAADFRVSLIPAVGPFTVGNIGLFCSDNTLFAIASLDSTQSKTATAGSVTGNTLLFDIVVAVTNVGATVNLSVTTAVGVTSVASTNTDGLLTITGSPITSSGTINYNASSTLLALLSTQRYRNLQGSYTTNTTATWTASQVNAVDSAGNVATASNFSQVVNIGVSGAGGIDTGTVSPSTWYHVYAIYNPTTATWKAIASLSAVAPVLTTGYTYYTRISSFRTDSLSYFIGFTQSGREVFYKVGSNLSALPQMISGSTGSTTIPTWVPVSLSAFVPPTAQLVKLGLVVYGSGGQVMAAPNPNYGAFGTANSPPMSVGVPGTVATTTVSMTGEFMIESSNVYYAAANGTLTTALLNCIGWSDSY